MSIMFAEDNTYKTKRLVITISEEDHKEIKAQAARRGITMRVLILRALAAQIRKQQYEMNG